MIETPGAARQLLLGAALVVLAGCIDWDEPKGTPGTEHDRYTHVDASIDAGPLDARVPKLDAAHARPGPVDATVLDDDDADEPNSDDASLDAQR